MPPPDTEGISTYKHQTLTLLLTFFNLIIDMISKNAELSVDIPPVIILEFSTSTVRNENENFVFGEP